VDERADIYGLGCTLWHLIVGHRAFSGTPKDVFAEQRVRGLSDPRFEGADISSALAKVIRRMGRVAPADRYRTWDELILDLTLIQHGSPAFAAELSDALRNDDNAAPSATDRQPNWEDTPSTPTLIEEEDGSSVKLEDVPSVPTLHAPVPDPIRRPAPQQDNPENPAAESDPVSDPVQEENAESESSEPGLSASAELAIGLQAREVLASPAPTADSPASPHARRGIAPMVLVAACIAAAAIGAFVENRIAPQPAQVLIRNARTRAENGKPAAAAAELRSAARLLPPAAAAQVLAEADRLDSQ